MTTAKHAVFGFFLLIALSCFAWYFASSSSVITVDETSLAKTPDSIIIGIKLRQFDAKGILVHFLESPHVEHIPEKNTYFFDYPHIILTQENDEPKWDIRSGKALALDKGKQITLIDQVVVHQDKGIKSPESTLKTEELVYFPEKKLATTRLDVIFEQPGSIIHSQGMNAYLNQKRVELLNKAHARYKPNHV